MTALRVTYERFVAVRYYGCPYACIRFIDQNLGLRFGFFFVGSVRSNRTNGSVRFGSAVRRTTYVRTSSTAYVCSYTYVEVGISEISALSAEFLRNEKHSFNHELPRCLAAATSTSLLASAIVNEVAAFCFLCRITHHPTFSSTSHCSEFLKPEKHGSRNI